MSVRDSIREMRDKAAKVAPKYFKSSGSSKYMRPSDLKEGTTTLRIAPPHDAINFPSPFLPSRYTYLEVELGVDELSNYNIKDIIDKQALTSDFGIEKSSDIFDMDKGDLITKAKQVLGQNFKTKVTKRLFISSMHAADGTVDLVESYIQYVVDKVNDEIGDKDERNARLAPVFGARIAGKWKPGINPSTNFVCYGWDWSADDKPLYKIELYGNMMNRIIELYDKFDDGDKPITVDSFSDAKTGIGLEFSKSKNKMGKWEYKIEDVPYLPQKFDTYTAFQESFALTDEMSKSLADTAPLVDHFGRKSFLKKDFELQLNGLFLFDEEHKFGAFQNDEFVEKVETIAAQFESKDGDDTTETQEEKDAKSGADVDKMFAEKEATKRKEAEEAETKRKAEAKEKADAAKKVEESSVKDENPKPTGQLNSRLDALRKNMKK